MKVDAENNLLLIKGALPGPNGGLLFVLQGMRAIMIEVPVFDQTGQKVESFRSMKRSSAAQVRTHLLKQAFDAYHANQRQGTVQTLARGEVAGITRKMFRQKGTGNARTGGIRNPDQKGRRTCQAKAAQGMAPGPAQKSPPPGPQQRHSDEAAEQRRARPE